MQNNVKVLNGIHELDADLTSSPYWNKDMAPTTLASRKWGMWDIAALWIGMSVCIPTYMLASSLIAGGMNWWQAILIITLGNFIVLLPMILNAHAGTKYGIPFPVFARASFGIRGAHVPSILRAIVACGWFGIQTWIGGAAIHQILSAVSSWWANLPVIDLGVVGSQSLGAWISFLFFWVINIYVVLRGMESIRHLEDWGAPFLLLIGLMLLIWAWMKAGGLGPMFEQGSKFTTNVEFWKFFFPALTGMVGFWATLSLNIPDFTRYAKSQKDQIWGQAIGLNTTMPFYSFIGVAVTSATLIIFGREIWDPIELLAQFKNPLIVILSMLGLTIATLTTNLAANVVSPANSISNLAPQKISFKMGGVITGVIGILMMPWKLIADPTGYIFTWLIGYSALLGPIGGVLICDYFLLRRTQLNLAELYQRGGEYEYQNGIHWNALIALLAGILPNVPGFLAAAKIVSAGSVSPFFQTLYTYSWFVGFAISFTLYYLLARGAVHGRKS